MLTFLSKIFIKPDLGVDEKRTIYGMLCGIVGICLNIMLFCGKLFAGIISNSISIMADAFNNLSDAGSSAITLVGFKLASHKPDADHPYGHGRIEYISGLIISAAIIVMGVELFRKSINKIIHPEVTKYTIVTLIILVASILVKFYMAFYNGRLGKKLNSAPLKATAMDSLSDCIATSLVLATTIFAYFTNIYLDGWCGLVVSVFIFYAGFTAGKESINPLLGTPPEPEYIEHIENIVVGFDEKIVGIHDLMVHDYGPGRRFVSLHAEVPADEDVLILHDIIDNLEKELGKQLSCLATIHMDPVDIKNPEVNILKEKVKNLVISISKELSIHDFRVVFGETHTNLIFDIVIPYSTNLKDEDVIKEIKTLLKENIGQEYNAVIDIDH